MPKVVQWWENGGQYRASVDGGPQFNVGRRVTYPPNGVGLANDGMTVARYDPDTYTDQYGCWAHFIYPTAMVEGNAALATVNTYDRAFFTFGLLQFSAADPDGDFVTLFRLLLTEEDAPEYFPDLVLKGGRVSKIEPAGLVPLETAASTEALMTYLNPSTQAIESEEVVNCAKLIEWTESSARIQAAQVGVCVSLFRSKMVSYAGQYGLDCRSDKVCQVVCDIRHQGRAHSDAIREALDTNGDDDRAYANLTQIGAGQYTSRLSGLRDEISRLEALGLMGRARYDLATRQFV